MAAYFRRDLGDLLLEDRYLTEGVLRAARRMAKRERVPMVVVLLEGGHVTEGQVVDLLARRARIPLVDPARASMDEDIIRELPYDLAEKHRALPLAIDRQRKGSPARLRLAMADPLDRDAIEEIEALTHHQVEPVAAPASALLAAIRFHYRGSISHGPLNDAPRWSGDLHPRGDTNTTKDQLLTTLPALPQDVLAEAIAGAAREADTRRAGRSTLPTGRPEGHITQPLPDPVDEEAPPAVPLELRVQALVDVLCDTGILSRRVYEEALRRLVQSHDE